MNWKQSTKNSHSSFSTSVFGTLKNCRERDEEKTSLDICSFRSLLWCVSIYWTITDQFSGREMFLFAKVCQRDFFLGGDSTWPSLDRRHQRRNAQICLPSFDREITSNECLFREQRRCGHSVVRMRIKFKKIFVDENENELNRLCHQRSLASTGTTSTSP